MTALAHHLATIDLLCARAFPAQRGRSAAVVSGPGFHIAELATSESFWDDEGTGRREAEEQYEAECGGLSALLTGRWGEPQIFSLRSTLIRSMEGEEMPEPWHELSGSVPYLEVWRAEGRWIALGVSQQDDELPFQLLAAVTANDPP
ncbi:MAG: hypothetical protein ACRDP3_27360 [Streptomyces sp.]|uniref:hypothetical protein n=1 Tax=Streptomyces sp. TaxID=1931 RepID=UPI003D6BD7C2